MPYSSKARYQHFRQLPPGRFIPESFRDVPVSHTSYHGSKFSGPKVRAVVGVLKGSHKRAVQSFLVPK